MKHDDFQNILYIDFYYYEFNGLIINCINVELTLDLKV